MQAVKAALVLQIFGGGELQINALRLEHNPDLTPQLGGIFGGVMPQNDGLPADWDHERRKNAEHGGFSAAIWPEKAEQFRGMNIEGNSVQRGTAVIAMNEIAYGDHR